MGTVWDVPEIPDSGHGTVVVVLLGPLSVVGDTLTDPGAPAGDVNDGDVVVVVGVAAAARTLT